MLYLCFTILQDVPVPAFMQNKAEDDWSEDEKKLAQEYEKKVKELQEERDKYKKVGVKISKKGRRQNKYKKVGVKISTKR